MQKKGQEGVIITVLLILVAIAAVAAVSYFVINQVRLGQTEAANKINCQMLNYEVVSAVSGQNTVTVRRTAGGDQLNVTNIIVSFGIKGTNKTTGPGMMELVSVSGFNMSSGDKIEVAPILSNGVTCDARTSLIVA
jgi:hypothetical protein